MDTIYFYVFFLFTREFGHCICTCCYFCRILLHCSCTVLLQLDAVLNVQFFIIHFFYLMLIFNKLLALLLYRPIS